MPYRVPVVGGGRAEEPLAAQVRTHEGTVPLCGDSGSHKQLNNGVMAPVHYIFWLPRIKWMKRELPLLMVRSGLQFPQCLERNLWMEGP